MRVKLRFIVDQKNEPALLQSIKDMFGGAAGVILCRRECTGMQRFVLEFSDSKYFVTEAAGRRRDSLAPIPREPKTGGAVERAFRAVFDYFDKYPLKSDKNIDYVRFKKIWVRLNDSRPRDHRSLARFMRLLEALPENHPRA